MLPDKDLPKVVLKRFELCKNSVQFITTSSSISRKEISQTHRNFLNEPEKSDLDDSDAEFKAGPTRKLRRKKTRQREQLEEVGVPAPEYSSSSSSDREYYAVPTKHPPNYMKDVADNNKLKKCYE